VIKFYLDRDARGWSWRLVNRTQQGADLIARSGTPSRDHAQALAQLRLLRDAAQVRIVHTGDGHWQWLLRGCDDTVAATSPAIYRDRVACQEAFADARQAAWTVARPESATQHAVARHV
jgi:hypothetical protein